MSEEMQTRLAERVLEFTLNLYPSATIVGPKIIVNDGISVYAAGLKRGVALIQGEEKTLIEMAQRAKGLTAEGADDFCGFWLSPGEQEATLALDPEDPPPATALVVHEPKIPDQRCGAEPEEIHPLRTGPAQYKGRDLQQRGVDLYQKISYLPDIHRLLPQAPDAEKGVLSSILLAPREIMRVCADKGITPAHFHLPNHRAIYGELESLFRLNKPIDFITFTQGLRDAGMLDQVGGAAYITELFTFLPTAAMAGYYIEILVEKWALRENIRHCTESAARSYDEQDNVWEVIEGGQNKLTRIVELAQGRRTRLPGLRDISTMLGENLPEPPMELIAGLLHQGSKLVIGGTSKGRKTFGLMDMAISVATGSDWWGLPTKKGRVCYINFEIQEAFFCRRANDICRAKGVTLEAGQLMAWTLRGHTEGIEKMVAELMVILLRENFVLIIFDPIYKALGDRDENKAGDVASLCNELERIAVKTGAAIAFGAHYSKGNQAAKESIDRIGGSGVFARDPDAIMAMTPHETDDCFTVEATLRNFAPMPPFVVKWEWPIFKREGEADPSALKQPKTAGKRFEAQFTHAMIVDELSVLEGLTSTALMRRVAEEHGMSKSTFHRFKAELVGSKKIVRKGDLFFRAGGSKS